MSRSLKIHSIVKGAVIMANAPQSLLFHLESSPLCKQIWQSLLPNNHFNLHGNQHNINLMAYILKISKEEILIKLGNELHITLDELKQWILENKR